MPLLTIRPAEVEGLAKSADIRKAIFTLLPILWTASLLVSSTHLIQRSNIGLSQAVDLGRLALCLTVALPPAALGLALHAFISVPAQLAHLPRAPLLPLLKSYLRNEPDDVRYRALILPMLDRDGHGIVLVWMLGRWIVHVLDWRLGRAMADTLALEKEAPPDGMLLWKLIGRQNFIFANGALWRRHASIIKRGFDSADPMPAVIEQTKALFHVMRTGGRVLTNNLAQRFALAAVGAAFFGYDFDAMGASDPEFIGRFNSVMHEIASPAYLLFPFLERLLPRPHVHREIAAFKSAFHTLIETRRRNKGTDLVSFMIEDEQLSVNEVCDNLITFFIASHDSSSGTISSLMYYLAIHPEYQQRARSEVRSVLGHSRDPTIGDLAAMPFIHACVREVLRINTPVTSSVPRTCPTAIVLGAYEIPASTSVMPNNYVWHHSEHAWPDAYTFQPERWLLKDGGVRTSAEAWLPFSAGPRQCTGRNFALIEMRAFFCLMVRHYEWTLPTDSIHRNGIKNAVSPFALSLPRDLYLDFRRRDVD